MSELPEHVARNRAYWNGYAKEWVQSGREDWAATEPRWGIFRVPESEVGLLPSDLEGVDAIVNLLPNSFRAPPATSCRAPKASPPPGSLSSISWTPNGKNPQETRLPVSIRRICSRRTSI